MFVIHINFHSFDRKKPHMNAPIPIDKCIIKCIQFSQSTTNCPGDELSSDKLSGDEQSRDELS